MARSQLQRFNLIVNLLESLACSGRTNSRSALVRPMHDLAECDRCDGKHGFASSPKGFDAFGGVKQAEAQALQLVFRYLAPGDARVVAERISGTLRRWDDRAPH